MFSQLQELAKNEKKQLIRSFAVGVMIVLFTLWLVEAVSVLAPSIYGDAQTTITKWGLPGAFIGVLLGSTIFPFPTDLFFTAAVQLSPTLWDKVVITGVAAIAAFVGSLINFFLAMFLRGKFVERFVNPGQLSSAKSWFDKYGPIPILFFGIVPASPVFDPITFVAGLIGMDKKEFALYSLASRVIHFTIIAALASGFSIF